MAEQIAQAATSLQLPPNGEAPKSVVVVMRGDTLVITLHGALSSAEEQMARSPVGAARVRKSHRQLFLEAADLLQQNIKRIIGKDVRQAAMEADPAIGTVALVFASGPMVQVILLSDMAPFGARSA